MANYGSGILPAQVVSLRSVYNLLASFSSPLSPFVVGVTSRSFQANLPPITPCSHESGRRTIDG